MEIGHICGSKDPIIRCQFLPSLSADSKQSQTKPQREFFYDKHKNFKKKNNVGGPMSPDL